MVMRQNRELIVSDLVGTMLGPKYGLTEVFHATMNPWKVYLTGVLAPNNAEPDEDAENEDIETTISEDNDVDVSQISDPEEFTPSLSSSSQPQSFGISFTASSPEDCAVLDCCFTWARYLWHPDWSRIQKEYEDSRLVGWYDEDFINEISKRVQEEGVKKKGANGEQDEGTKEDNYVVDEEKKKGGSFLVEDDSEEPDLTPTIFGGWKRDPRYLILKGLKVCPDSDKIFIDQTTVKNSEIIQELDYAFPEEDEAFRIYIRIRKLSIITQTKLNYFHISLYFVNDAERIYITDLPEVEQKASLGKPTEAYIFQPQIRIKCRGDTQIVSEELHSAKEIYFEKEEEMALENEKDELETYLKGIDCISNEKPPEDKILNLIYMKKRQKAKGHMCSAIWDEIDPERPYENTDAIRSPPFHWTDGELLKDPDRNYFYLPDIRTEFVPIISVSAPDFNWRRNIAYSNGKIVQSPLTGNTRDETFLDPLFIAEKCWDREVLKVTFHELIEEYENWMRAQSQIILNSYVYKSNPNIARIAKYNLRNHLKIYKRIKRGLQVLDSNPEARICFCYANKVIQLQNYWVEKRKPNPMKFYWRPFQIAFLLLSISGIINKDDVDRDYIDLIWFPTGGGKTEAYLLTAAFTLAYRRRIAYKDSEKLPFIENGTYLISRYTLRLLTIQQFRRANLMVLAADCLRVKNLSQRFGNSIVGWLPEDFGINDNPEVKKQFGYLWEGYNWIWGTHRFSVGLWVGSGMTPNRLERSWAFGRPYYGALDALKVKIDLTKEMEEKARAKETVDEDDVDQDAPPISDADEQPQDPEVSRTINRNIRNVVKEIGDPAQIVSCPVCDAVLSLPKSREQYLSTEINNFFLLMKVKDTTIIPDGNTLRIKLESVINSSVNLFPFVNRILGIVVWKSPDIYSVNFSFKARDDRNYDSERLEEWWLNLSHQISPIEILSVDIRNPGYYYLYHINKCYDFEIRCCNPKCELNLVNWAEGTNIPNEDTFWTKNSDQWIENDTKIARSIPISAYTVDEQIYRRLPSLVIGTVDKFAQLAFNDNAGTMLGHLELYSPKFGFFKENVVPKIVDVKIRTFDIGLLDPPEIILQDELHLIVGPLGSMVGIYETVIDELCKRMEGERELRPKYIASTATIKAGEQQTQCLYNRKFSIFPPYGIDEADSFFLINQDLHPCKEDVPGRLYIGLCCPGKSAQTPLSHIWGSIFQKTFELMQSIKDNPDPTFTLDQRNEQLRQLDPYWTIVGYFNAIRELAGVRAVYSQEFVAWMRLFYGKTKFRPFHEKLNEPIELSSRTDSIVLPEYFERLDKSLKLIDDGSEGYKVREPVNGVLTTSIFGTGVDVVRLGVMVVNGQPKTTASYIQATGRIGRRIGGIATILLRAGRPRDLDHYERFSGYHRAIYKYVEPITVMPFSLNCMKIAFGPLAVALLRQSKNIKNLPISTSWRGKQNGHTNIINLNQLSGNPVSTPVEPINSMEFNQIIKVFEDRLQTQDTARKPKQEHYDEAKNEFFEKSGRWQEYAINIKPKKAFAYSETTMDNPPSKSVVLGDPQHQVAASKPKKATSTAPLIHVVFQNSPMSLRGVEKMTTFGIFADYKKTKEKIERKTMRKRRGGKKPSKKPAKKTERKPPKLGPVRGVKRRPPKGVFRRT